MLLLLAVLGSGGVILSELGLFIAAGPEGEHFIVLNVEPWRYLDYFVDDVKHL